MPWLEPLAARDDARAALLIDLAESYVEAGEMEKAVGAIDRATRSDTSPLDLARAAGVLERTGLATERAVRYAARLADDLRAELAAHDVTDPAVLQRAPATNHIAMRVLDVLGCAAVARREWSEAERFLGPAWSLRPIEMHALSLVRLYGASGRRSRRVRCSWSASSTGLGIARRSARW